TDRGRSISRDRKSSNFERSLPVLCDLTKKDNVLSSEVRAVTGVDDCCSSNAGLWFRTLVRPSGNVEHNQVPSLERWKRSIDIGDDIDIAYYNGTGAVVVEEGFFCYLNQVAYGLSIPLTFFQKGVINILKSCPGQLNGNIFEMRRICEALNHKWRDGGNARQFVADDVLKYYKFKYVKDRKSGYLFSDSARPKFFDFESSGRPWCDHLVMVRGNCMQVPGEPALELIYKNFNERPNPKVVADTSSLFDVLFVAWKLAAEVLKLAATNRGELVRQHDAEKAALQVKDEAKKVVDIAVASRNKLIQAFYLWDLSREDVDLSLVGKFGEIVFPGDDASSVVEQTPALPVADDLTKEEVVHLGGKVIEMGKALSRARDSINRTQQVHNKLEYERRLHKLNFDKTFKELFELQCRYGKIKIKWDEVLQKETDRFILLQTSLKDKQFVDENDKLECQRSLLSLTLYFEAEVDSEWGLKEAYLEPLTERRIVSDPARGQKAMMIIFFNIKKEDRKIYAQIEIDLRHACDELERCKGHNACLEREKVECARLLQSTGKRVTLLEARLLDMQQRLDEGGGASTSTPRAEESEEEEVEDLLPRTRHKTRLQEVVIFNEPLQVDASSSREKDLWKLDVKILKATEFCEATLLTADNVTLRAMAMLHADVEKFRTERESILAAITEYVTEYELQLARLSYIDNLMPRVMELLNAPSTVADVAILFPVLLSSGPGESSNVLRPKREQYFHCLYYNETEYKYVFAVEKC
ncbi:hypothetical protein GIB67_025392, partial [Kingdonia uniflora]